MSVFKKLQDIIKLNFSSEEQLKLAEIANAPIPEPVKLTEVKTLDGQVISYEGTLAVGVAVFTTDASGVKAPLADGLFTLEDNSTITVAGGMVTELSQAGIEDAELKKAVEGIATQMSSHKKDSEKIISDLESRIKTLEQTNKFLAVSMKKIIDTEIDTEETQVKKWEDMTSLERAQYNRGLKVK